MSGALRDIALIVLLVLAGGAFAAAEIALAPLVDRIAVVLRPVIWFLSKSTDVVVRLVGGDPRAQREEMSDEESRYPVIRGSADDVVGFVHIRDLFVRDYGGEATSLRVGDVVREVMPLPQSVRLLPVRDGHRLRRRPPRPAARGG